jgi:hypothetical protein
MHSVLYFSPNGAVYEGNIYSTADIARLVRDDSLETLTSTDRQFDFWFTPSTRPCHRIANPAATEMLLATTGFTAKSVPLLRGAVVVAAHDGDGALDGLSWQQLDHLAQRNRSLTRREHWVLGRRIARDRRAELRSLAARAEAGGRLRHRPTARH